MARWCYTYRCAMWNALLFNISVHGQRQTKSCFAALPEKQNLQTWGCVQAEINSALACWSDNMLTWVLGQHMAVSHQRESVAGHLWLPEICTGLSVQGTVNRGGNSLQAWRFFLWDPGESIQLVKQCWSHWTAWLEVNITISHLESYHYRKCLFHLKE